MIEGEIRAGDRLIWMPEDPVERHIVTVLHIYPALKRGEQMVTLKGHRSRRAGAGFYESRIREICSRRAERRTAGEEP